MKCTLLKKIKIFFVVALALIVVGFTMFGIFGFYQTVDYKPSYEVQVSVDQKAGNTTSVLKDAAEDYFSDNGIKVLCYGTQTLDDGAVVIYKFNLDITEKVQGLKAYIQAQLDADSTVSNVLADANVYESLGNNTPSFLPLLIAIGIAIAVIFVYALIMNKLASAVATIFASVLSGVMFIALTALVRIPSAPSFAFGCGLAIIIASMLSIALTSKYKVLLKNENKLSSFDIAEEVFAKSFRIFIYVSALVLLSSIALCAFALPYMMFVGAHVLVAGICGISSAMFATPFIWSLIKKTK